MIGSGTVAALADLDAVVRGCECVGDYIAAAVSDLVYSNVP